VKSREVTRRTVLATAAAAAATSLVAAQSNGPLAKPILGTNEALPLVGLGSWLTFNVGDDIAARDSCAGVMRAFFAAGGRLIDSSPMYGSSQEVIGYGIKKAGNASALFAATKVWISGGKNGPGQIEESRRLWGVPRFDLLQVHSLLSWEEHLPTLFAMKAEGKLRYAGVTTSHGRSHGELEGIMRTQPLDFIQATYNVSMRSLESRILPLAAERGINVIINRPFDGGDLIRALAGKSLPNWAAEIGAASWAQILLKFIVSHPAVSCAIPATTRADHAQENLAAARAPLPDKALRARILAAVEAA
jgi:diketogulonate reductase-like aldo/keto reductase